MSRKPRRGPVGYDHAEEGSSEESSKKSDRFPRGLTLLLSAVLIIAIGFLIDLFGAI